MSDAALYFVEYLNVEVFTKEKNDLFPDDMGRLVSDWDSEELGRRDELYGKLILTSYVYATQIVIEEINIYWLHSF